MSGPSGLRFCFRFEAFSVPDFVFFVILGSFLGGTPLRDHLFRPKGAGGPPGRPRDLFLTTFWGADLDTRSFSALLGRTWGRGWCVLRGLGGPRG